jgi:hypothetical protein
MNVSTSEVPDGDFLYKTVFSRFKNSQRPDQKQVHHCSTQSLHAGFHCFYGPLQIVITLLAIREVLGEQQLIPSDTTYFGALMSALESTSKVCPCAHSLVWSVCAPLPRWCDRPPTRIMLQENEVAAVVHLLGLVYPRCCLGLLVFRLSGD